MCGQMCEQRAIAPTAIAPVSSSHSTGGYSHSTDGYLLAPGTRHTDRWTDRQTHFRTRQLGARCIAARPARTGRGRSVSHSPRHDTAQLVPETAPSYRRRRRETVGRHPIGRRARPQQTLPHTLSRHRRHECRPPNNHNLLPTLLPTWNKHICDVTLIIHHLIRQSD